MFVQGGLVPKRSFINGLTSAYICDAIHVCNKRDKEYVGKSAEGSLSMSMLMHCCLVMLLQDRAEKTCREGEALRAVCSLSYLT